MTLKVYDVIGNEVATLVNEKQNSGTYNYQFSTVNYQLSSGVYFYKIERQIKKHKEKSRDRKAGTSRAEERGGLREASAGIEDEPRSRVVETRKVVLKPMSLEEAMIEMEGSRNRFVIYRDALSENISVIYRREDGNFALLEANS